VSAPATGVLAERTAQPNDQLTTGQELGAIEED
jgi:hypothetical protein